MIEFDLIFPVKYDSESFDPYAGLWKVSPEAVAFYERVFGLEFSPDKTCPFGDDESVFDEKVSNWDIGFEDVKLCRTTAPGIAFMVSDLDEARKSAQKLKLAIGEETDTEQHEAFLITDPDKNPVVIFADK